MILRWQLLIGLVAATLLVWTAVGCDDGETDGDGDGDCISEACHSAPYQIDVVSGRALDVDGDPWEGTLSALICVTSSTVSRCLFGEVDAAGEFAVNVSSITDILEVSVYFTSPEVLPMTPFCRYTELCDGDVRLCGPFALHVAPTAAAGTTVPVEAALTEELRVEAADGGALIFAAGSEVRPRIGYDWLALTRFDLTADTPCFVDSDNMPAMLYAVTPTDTEIIEPGSMTSPVHVNAGLDLPNDAGLDAGAEVDIYVLGGMHALQIADDFHEGEWRQWATATVSADGSRIQTADGEGIPYLTWFGVYPR
jgi:hypothetical protein